MSFNAQKYKALRRKHKKEILLNDYEVKALNNYCRKFKISNKSKVIRDALFAKVLKGFDDNYPTLFSDEEMQRLEKYK